MWHARLRSIDAFPSPEGPNVVGREGEPFSFFALDGEPRVPVVRRTNTTPSSPPSDAAVLRHLMEAKGVTQAQLLRDTTIPGSMISEKLAGK